MTPLAGWALETDRSDLTSTELVEVGELAPGDGEAVLRVDRVGLTTNNVTYGVLGESFRYWQFFPATDASRGRVPLWGFAEVVASTVDGVEPGQRYYGYLPPASQLLVRPERVDGHGFRDATSYRAELPSPYNAYALTTGDAAYSAEHEDLQVLFRPLFFTSFMLADQLVADSFGGAGTLVFSSASSKTAYGTAQVLRAGTAGDADVRLVGLTSPGNLEFTRSVGCYDTVLTYDEVADLPDAPTVYVDMAGSADVRQRLHDHLGQSLVRDVVVGVTHQDSTQAGSLTGARPTVFFAPERIRVRTQEWGRDGLDEEFGAAWKTFVPQVQGWVDVVESTGPDGLQRLWDDVVRGTSDPRVGNVVQL